jgi:hypothetical protein
MDPYLEGSLWTSVHTELTVEIARQLSPLLHPRYIAMTTRRFVMEGPESVDVSSVESYVAVRTAAAIAAGTTKSEIVGAPLQMTTPIPAPVPHVSVEIRDVATRRLVTAIEVLSPTYKRGSGREEYLAKRQRVRRSTAHLIEIDLLRRGTRVPMDCVLPSVPYFIILSRFESRPKCDVWPIALDASLPGIPVPLLAGDADIQLNLQHALAAVYDVFGYQFAIDYNKPPEVPLSADSAAWADRLLRAGGWRS